MVLNEEKYLAQRIVGWHRLAALCAKADRTFRDLTGAEIVEYVRLYRQASGDLAYLVTNSSNQDVVSYLNALVSQAYGQLYRSRTGKFKQVIQQGLYLSATTFRRQFKWILGSAILFVVAALYAAGMMTAYPQTRSYFVPPAYEETFDHWKSGKHEGRSADEGLMATGMYATNNPRVGIMTVGIAAGTAGIGSTMLVWQNGVLIGSLAKEVSTVGQTWFLFSSIAPHGVSEIGGIFVAAAAGYVIVAGLLFPGRRRWSDSLKHAGKDGFVLTVLALILIFAAAPIEGFFSFNPAVPQEVKAVFALVAFAGWTAFFAGYGRNIDPVSIGLPPESEELLEN